MAIKPSIQIPIKMMPSPPLASSLTHSSSVMTAFEGAGQGALQLANPLPPLALYVHFPWCVKKCPYCDFNSHEKNEHFDEMVYIKALRADIEQALPLIWGRKMVSVFIGGGTPSLMSAAALDQLLSDIRCLLPLEADAEITLEANPGTFESEKFAQYRASGINRLSIGIQSFNDKHLKQLGRIHDGNEAQAAIEIAQKYFENFNLDLMFALPSQSLEESAQDLQRALYFQPTHLSLYHLTIEPNTYFAKFPPSIPDDDLSSQMQAYITQHMQEAGYMHYEVSAFAKPHQQSKHNLNYWQFGDYLGVGAGAHSKISFPHRITREVRFKHPKTYMEHILGQTGHAIEERSDIAAQDLPFEFMLNAMRLNQGFPLSWYVDRVGLPLNTIEAALQKLEKKGLVVEENLHIKPTELGKRFLNDVQEAFLLD